MSHRSHQRGELARGEHHSFDLRPLDRLTSVRMKFAIVIIITVGVTVVVSYLGARSNLSAMLWPPVAIVLSLLLVRVIAHGLTAPLREMEAAASAMAKGDYTRRVRATGRDEVGRLAAAFNRMAADLAEVERQRKDLVANVSHELRTPLSALQAELENIVDGISPADPEVFRAMLGQVERLGSLVSQLLDLSRLEAGAIPLHVRRVPVRAVLEQVADECRFHRPHHDIRVEVVPADLTVEADVERMHQVLANLVDNAVRHSPPSAPVEVIGRAQGSGVVIEVTDAGPGIPEEERNRVFERFYRADRSRTANGSGAGLGLAIARWIVDLHGGDIHAEQRTPQGCRMVIELPG